MIRVLPSSVDLPLASIPLTSPTERTELITRSAGEAVLLDPQTLTLPELFAAQVAKTPQATALVFEDPTNPELTQSLSYAQLDAQSNQLARHLIAQGIGPDQIVAILLDRSPQMIVSMLAVLKAGGAYLPLDPEYPVARLGFMLEDSGARQVITSKARYGNLVGELARLATEEREANQL